jgi:hypothetical protein
VTPLLTRGEIIRAVRIRKLLEQAGSEPNPDTAEAYVAKAKQLARGYPRGWAIIYNREPLLGDDDDGHPHFSRHRDNLAAP